MKKDLYKAGYVAIVGEPNVGKSTLLNALLNQKISIVTRKPQTTRQRILGILSRDDSQIIFYDTPGLLKPKYLLHKEMMKHVFSALADADIIVLMIDLNQNIELSREVIENILPLCRTKTLFLVINKVDKLNDNILSSAINTLSQHNEFKKIIPISALNRYNIETLVDSIIDNLPIHEPFYPHDVVSEHPERFFVAEFIREKIFEKFRDEVPYSSAIEIREFKENEERKTFINADIIVEKESQKGIMIGKKGSALKEIGVEARKIIEDFLQHEVFLELHVKVRNKWRENESMIQRLGYKSRQ